MKEQPKTVWANFGFGLMGRLASQAFSFVIVVYLARVLGPADYGDLSWALAVVSYFNLLANFGLHTVGTREIARDQTNCQESANQILSLRVWLAILSYVLLILYGYFLVSNLRLLYLLLLYGLTLLSSSWFLDWFFVGMEDMKSLTIANMLGSLLSGLFTFLLVKDVNDIYFIPAVSFAGSVLACLYLLNLYRKNHSVRLSLNFGFFFKWLKLSVPFAFTGLLSQVYGNMDMLLIGYFAGSEEVGYYSVAYKIVFVLSGIIGIYSQSTWPVMIRLFENNKQELGVFLKQNLHSMLYFMLPIVTGGTLLGGNIIEAFFGERYMPAAVPFILLLYYVFLMAISITLANLLLATKKDKVYLSTLTLGALVNVLANLVLIPAWRATGAAVAMVITELVIVVFLLSKANSLHKGEWIDSKFLFAVAASNGVMAMGIAGSMKWLQVHVGIEILLGAILYIGVSWPFCVKYIRRTHAE